jgi:four helix bundle protein
MRGGGEAGKRYVIGRIDNARPFSSRILCSMETSSTRAHPRIPARYERLKSWVACHELALSVYRVTSKWPSQEQYGLISQARRAAYSVAANIAEGSAKKGSRDFCRFLNVSLGSLSELSYALRLARDLEYLRAEQWGEIEALRDHAGRLTWGLYQSLVSGRNSKPSGDQS